MFYIRKFKNRIQKPSNIPIYQIIELFILFSQQAYEGFNKDGKIKHPEPFFDSEKVHLIFSATNL